MAILLTLSAEEFRNDANSPWPALSDEEREIHR